jgi:hypothetical protein
MLPADERLHADDRPRRQVHQRLVEDHQLVLAERFPQHVLQRQPLQGAGIHGRRVELVVVAPLLLGPVHGRVGVPHQRLRIAAVLGIEADADAGRDEQLAVGDGEGDLERVDDLLGDLGRVLDLLDARDHQRELVAAETGHRVALAHAAAHPLRHQAQESVPHRVSEGVVDVLEAIEVEEEDRQLLIVASGLCQRHDESVDEERPVG